MAESIRWTRLADGYGTGVYQLRWWRDPAGQKYLVHTHGTGSAKPGETVISGRDLLTGRRLTVLVRAVPKADVPEYRAGWEVGKPDPSWDDAERLTGIPTARHRGYRGIGHHQDALVCHPVAAAARGLLEQDNLPAGVVSCPECCAGRHLIEYAWDRIAADIGDRSDDSRLLDWHDLTSDQGEPEPITPEDAFRQAFEDMFERATHCPHGAARWSLGQAWESTGWAEAQPRLAGLVEAQRAAFTARQRGALPGPGPEARRRSAREHDEPAFLVRRNV